MTWSFSQHRASRLALAAVVVLACALGPGWRPQSPAALADEPAAASLDPVERMQLNEVIYRNREGDYLLRSARRELEAGRTAAGLELFQKLLDEEDDSFDWDPRSGNLTSARAVLRELFVGMTPTQRQAYEQSSGRDARRMLDDIRLAGRRDLLAVLVRRYYFTSAGFEALDHLATLWSERGEHGRAARCWYRLCTDPLHAARVTPQILVKAAAAHRLAGLEKQAHELLARLPDRNQELAGRNLDAVRWIQQLTPAHRGPIRVEEWLQFDGNPSRNATADGSPPALQAAWSAPLQRGSASVWGSAAQDLTPNFPLIVGEQLIVRDSTGITGRSLSGGEVLWHYESPVARYDSRAFPSFDERGRRNVSADPSEITQRFLSFVASDAARLYAVEFESRAPARNGFGFDITPPFSTKLVAIDLHQAGARRQTVTPAWVADLGGAAHADEALAQHIILGPPMPVDGIVYLMTEADRQVNLVAVSGETGELLWVQGIALVQEPIWFPDEIRRLLAGYTPGFAAGIIVCPTATGLLVAVDGLTGELLWARHYGEPPEQRVRRMAARPKRSWQNETALSDVPHVHNDRVVYLPSDSPEVHAFDLQSGRTLWTAAREDAQYIGCITDEVVLLVGERYARGLATDSGKPAWKSPLRLEAPSGRGVSLGRTYLLPLKTGAVVQIDLATGETVGIPFHRAEVVSAGRDLYGHGSAPVPAVARGVEAPYGNLVASAEVVVSLSPESVSVFPQAEALLARLQSEAGGNDPGEAPLRIAELQMLIGDETSAGETLRSWLGRGADRDQQQRGEALLRELICYKLDRGQGDAAELLTDLDRLSRTEPERGRFLVRSVAHDLDAGRWDGVFKSLDAFAALDDVGAFSQPGEHRLRLSGRSWIASVRRRLMSELNEEQRTAVFESERSRADRLAADADVKRLEQFLEVHRGTPVGHGAQVALARRLYAQGQFQRAELLLLEVLGSRPEPEFEAGARLTLAELWNQVGLYDEAGRMLVELERRCEGASLPDDRSVRESLQAIPTDSLVGLAYRRSLPIDWHVSRVVIDEHRWLGADPRLGEVYNTRRAGFLTPDGSTFDLLNTGRRGESRLAIADRMTGTLVGEIEMPEGWRYPHWARYRWVGHFVPIGSAGAIHGVSLLQRDNSRPLWSRPLTGPSGTEHGEVHVGPAGPGYAIFQSNRGQVLTAVDPATGGLLWQRTDLEPGSGLFGSPQLGLFGDGQVLVSFEKDGKSYTVYRTLTGEEVRKGRLEIDPHYKPFARGSRMLFYAAFAAGRRLQIWNAATNRVEFDAPFVAGHSAENERTGELAVLDPTGGRFRILDLEAGRTRIDVRLSSLPASTLRSIRFFDDHERYFVNFQTVSNPQRGASSWVPDTYLAKEDVLGEVYAIRKSDGRVLWHRSFAQRSLLRLPQYQLPFLVALSRSGPSRLVNQGPSRRFGIVPSRGNGDNMRVEVIDASTGEILAQREHILSDRFVLSRFDLDAGVLQLLGLRGRLDFLFDRGRQHSFWGDEPL